MESLSVQLQPFFVWLLRSTLQASMLIGLILLVQITLRSKLGPRWSHAIWLVLLLRMVLPWAPQSRASIFNLIPQSFPQIQTEYAPAQPANENFKSPVADKKTTPAFAGAGSASAQAEVTSVSTSDTSEASSQPTAAVPQPGPAEARQAKSAFLRAAKVLPLIWLAGALVLGIYICASNFNLLRIVRRERPLTDQKILDLLEDCKAEMGIRTILGVVATDKVKSACLFGFVRPRLLLPKGMIEALNREELRYVFLHELGHLKRHDIYLGWLMSILQVLHWFNPLVWLAFYRMRADRELACDALVLGRLTSAVPTERGPSGGLAGMQADESRNYGRTIVSLLERFSRPQVLPALVGILETKAQLKRRVRMIAEFKKNSYQWSPLAVGLIIVLGCVSLPNAKREKTSEGTSATWSSGTGNWVNYTSGAQITAMVEDGDYLWVGSYGGLTKLNRRTGAMTHYNRANSGLPDNSVSCIARDVSGDLWIGTRGGLAKFDGTDWTIYRSETCLQPGNGVSCLAIDKNGIKWINVSGRGLARFDGTTWTFYSESNSGLPTDDFRSISIDAKGNKWLGTNGRGLAKFDGTNWTVYDPKNSGIPGVGVYPIAFDTNGDVWVGCQGWDCPNGLAKFDGTNWTVYNEDNSQLPANCVRSIAIDTDGSKWIGTYRGLARFDSTNWTVYDTDHLKLAATDGWNLPDRDVWTILVDADGVKWFGFYGGLVRFDGTNWAVYNTGTSLLPDNHVTSIVIDVQGTKWITTWGGGLAKLDDEGWTIYNRLNSDIPGGGDVTRVFAVDNDKAVWLGVYGGGLVRFDGTTWTIYSTENSGLPRGPRCVAVDANGDKWIGAVDGLATFDGLEWTVYRSENSPLPFDDVGVIVIDKDGNKWIGGGTPSPLSAKGPKGLAKFDGTNWTVYNTDNSGLPSNSVWCLAIDAGGNKWIGTDKGLVRFDGSNWAVFDSRNSPLLSAPIPWLCAAPDGSVWGLQSTKGGIWNMFRVHDDGWTVIKLDNSGLPCCLINCFCMDHKGGFWFGTMGGLGWLTQVNLSDVNQKPASDAAYRFAVPHLQRGADKPIVLPVPMAQFPRTLNGWTGQDLLIPTTTQEYMQANPPDDYFHRRYVNGNTGQWADLYVVYCSSEPMRVFGHQPTDCYPANGWTWDQTDPLRIVTQSGRRIDCLVDRFHRASPVRQEMVVLSFYVLSGRLHASERDLVDFWPQGPNTSRDPARYAAQVQVASVLESSVRSAACAMTDAILDFLPDPNGVVHAEPDREN